MLPKNLKATAILIGTTIGAGIFGLPYAIAQVGFLPGFIYLLVLGAIILLVNLIYGEVILRTPGDHQLTGYGQIYFGSWGRLIASLALFISLYGALLAYLIKIGEFLALILGLPLALEFSLGFALLAGLTIFLGLKIIGPVELFLVSLMIGFIALIALLGGHQINWSNLQTINLNPSTFALPYGVILFALAGSASIPEMEEVLRKRPSQLKKSIVFGSLIPLLTYFVFAITIVGISGLQTSDDAIAGLVGFLPPGIVNLGAGLGILTMATSFLALGYVLREVWYRDFKLPKLPALLCALLPSFILFILGAKSFITVLEVTGALTGGLSGILIILLHRKAQKIGRKEPAYQLKISSAITWGLMAIFALGMVSPFF